MASVHRRERQDGSVAWQVKWRENGRSASTTATSAAAARRIKAIVETTGTWRDEYATADVPTVDEQAAVYLAHGTAGNADTVEGYRRIVARHISPAFGQVALTALSVPMLTAWVRSIPGSDKTRANVRAVLSGILESAVPEHLPTNPMRKVKVARTDPPRDLRALSTAEFALLLSEIPEHHRPLVVTLAMTGLRWGEATALTVGDVEVKAGCPVFRVVKAVKHRARQGDAPGRPKTARSVRIVTGPAELLPAIEPLLRRPKRDALFTAPKGGRVRNSTFHTLVWQPALGRAQERGLSFRPRIHDLRAATTTWLIEQGVPIDIVADQLGHESVTTTFGIYRRVNPESGRRAAVAMGAVLGEITAAAEVRTLDAAPAPR